MEVEKDVEGSDYTINHLSGGTEGKHEESSVKVVGLSAVKKYRNF